MKSSLISAASMLDRRIRHSPGIRSSLRNRCHSRNGGRPDRPRVVSTRNGRRGSADDDLPIAVADQPAGLLFDVGWGPALQPGPHVGDDAIRALQDAPVLHFHVGALAAVEMADAARHVDNPQPLQHVAQLALVADNLEDARQPRDCCGSRVA